MEVPQMGIQVKKTLFILVFCAPLTLTNCGLKDFANQRSSEKSSSDQTEESDSKDASDIEMTRNGDGYEFSLALPDGTEDLEGKDDSDSEKLSLPESKRISFNCATKPIAGDSSNAQATIVITLSEYSSSGSAQLVERFKTHFDCKGRAVVKVSDLSKNKKYSVGIFVYNSKGELVISGKSEIFSLEDNRIKILMGRVTPGEKGDVLIDVIFPKENKDYALIKCLFLSRLKSNICTATLFLFANNRYDQRILAPAYQGRCQAEAPYFKSCNIKVRVAGMYSVAQNCRTIGEAQTVKVALGDEVSVKLPPCVIIDPPKPKPTEEPKPTEDPDPNPKPTDDPEPEPTGDPKPEPNYGKIHCHFSDAKQKNICRAELMNTTLGNEFAPDVETTITCRTYGDDYTNGTCTMVAYHEGVYLVNSVCASIGTTNVSKATKIELKFGHAYDVRLLSCSDIPPTPTPTPTPDPEPQPEYAKVTCHFSNAKAKNLCRADLLDWYRLDPESDDQIIAETTVFCNSAGDSSNLASCTMLLRTAGYYSVKPVCYNGITSGQETKLYVKLGGSYDVKFRSCEETHSDPNPSPTPLPDVGTGENH